ncbi:MAG: hypothetical protein LUC43_02175 [Burkholderiales bacterium]|nr:hypothetical protein [Burkholderiales bacterium]
MQDENSQHTYYLSPATNADFKKFLENLSAENNHNEKAVETLLGDSYSLLIPDTGGLVGDAIHRGLLKTKTGAQLSYPDYLYYCEPKGNEESIAEKQWGLPYDAELPTFRLLGALIAWQYTQTIVMSIPSFRASQDLHGATAESIPIELFYSLHGLPMYVPVESERFWGVMIMANPKLSEEEVIKYYSGPETLSQKPEGATKQFFSLQFLLFGKNYDPEKIDILSLWHNASRIYVDKKVEEIDRLQGAMPISLLQEEFASRKVDRTISQPCMDALMAVLYLLASPPYPNWIQDKKVVKIKTDQKTGNLIAEPPAKPNTVVLTPECCIDLSGPNGSVTIQERKIDQTHQ